MPFEWKLYLDLAIALRDTPSIGGSQEATYRCSVSRAYYAAFGHALEWATKNLAFEATRNVEERSKDHGRLKAHYKSKRRVHIGRKLDRLRGWRNDCDYERDLDESDWPIMVNNALKLAKEVIEELIPPPPPPSAQ
jgi:hypothetical protein